MSDHELRKEMIMGVIDEMRGPRFNINEVVKYNPATEYLVGTVIPMDWKPPIKDNRTMDDLDSVNINDVDYVGSDDSNSGIDNVLGNNSPILNPNSQIRSFGLSFMVDSQENISLDICVTWGRYFKDEDSEEGFSLNGVLSKRQSDDLMWKRESFGEVRNVNVDNSFKKGKKIRVYESDDGLINLFIKRQELNIALVLTFILTGLGSIYAGNTKKGLTLLILRVLFAALAFFSNIFGILSVLVWVYGFYEVYNDVQIANRNSSPNLINDFKNWNQQNKIIAILIICVILILTLNSLISFSSTNSYPSDDSDTSNYVSYSYESPSSHYRGVDTSPDTLAKNDPDSYYDYYEYGDNPDVDDYLESEGYD